jgi:hypothetical protein
MPNSRNIQSMAQSRMKNGNINDLRAKPFKPLRYLQARIEEPTIG